MKKLLVSCFLFFISCFSLMHALPVMADSTTLHINKQTTDIANFPVTFYPDYSKALSIADVVDKDFSKQVINSRFQWGIEDANYWISFSVKNDTDKKINRIFYFDEVVLKNANLYYQNSNGKWLEEKSGVDVPIAQRNVKNVLPSFIISFAPGEVKKLYFMMHTPHQLVTYGLHIKSWQTYFSDNKLESSAYSLFFGISLSMIFYNLFLFVSLKDRLYLFYVCYVFSFFMFVVQYSGFGLYLISSGKVHFSLAAFIAWSISSLSIFLKFLLNTREELPILNKALNINIVVFVLLGIAMVIDERSYFLVNLLALPATILFCLLASCAWIKKLPSAKYVVFGMSWHVLGLLLNVSANVGYVEFNWFTRNAFILGSVIELFVFSLALADRVRRLQKQKKDAQQQLLAVELKAKDKLELLVKKRTEELLQTNLKLEKVSLEDALTKVYNRRYFDSAIEKEWTRMMRAESNLSLLLCDIDFFKKYNDHYGHQAGDKCLKATTRAMISTIQRSSDFIARYGGEEFAIVLPNTSNEQACLLAERIHLALKKKQLAHEMSPLGYVTISIGVVTQIPNPEQSIEQMIAQADTALYQSKAKGRNCTVSFTDIRAC